MRSLNERIGTGLLHKCYSVGATLVMPLVLVGLLCSTRGRRRLAERFGVWGRIDPVVWWLHGASVGEVQGLLPLVRRIRAAQSRAPVLLTATSPTGLERGASEVDTVRLAPLDSPLLVSGVVQKLPFERFVITETELWPNLLRAALDTGKPCHIINGRISSYTAAWYARTSSIFAPLLARFTSISVPDEQQRQSFISCGAAPNRVHVTGHTKYDTEPQYRGPHERQTARELFFPGLSGSVPVVTLGSIRNGEEQFWFGALKQLWDAGKSVKVIVAPRHAERFNFFWDELAAYTQKRVRWSDGVVAKESDRDVVLLDTMGMLERAYAASDLAFVGATMVDIGGHNPLEPAMYGVPLAVGRYTSVIEEIISQLEAAESVVRVGSQADVYAVLTKLCSGPDWFRAAGERAKKVCATHRGSVERVLRVIHESEGAL